MSPSELPIRISEPRASRYAFDTHCCAGSPPPRSRSIDGSATLTIDPSIAATPEPRIAATSVSRWLRLIGQPLAYERGGGEGEPGGSPSVSKKGAAWGKHGFPPRERADGERRSCPLEPGRSPAQTKRWTKASAVSATSRHPLSTVSACPRPGIVTNSVTASFRFCRL